jgi:M6 family metalloprotease-like protein
MRARGHAGRAVLLVLAALVVVLASAPLRGEPLVCTKGEPPREAARAVVSKIFEDELPRVSAIETARRRGRTLGETTTVRLLALRVQFQPDTDSRSTGDGTFDYSQSDGTTFDGPPHDRLYFELHMTALANYYGSVSYDRLNLEWDVVPAAPEAAYTLPHDMGYYHDYSDEQVWYVSQVEEFTRDAFASADAADTIDFSQYDGYVIFHAGADWQSDVDLDTPFDLPSAHISLGEPVLVNGGACEVWDAAIMPETSSQDGLTIVLNGTLAHEVGHVLGLPDLYNTYNFFPSIGYWCIMDSGGRIGMNTPWGWAYGLLPAAPCAWAKEYMGWSQPTVILEDAGPVEVKASVLRGPGERLYRIPITSDEYFLIENRIDDIPHVDPNSPGYVPTVALNEENGVVLGPIDPGCDPDLQVCPVNHEYDFLLPGPGLMIYHVDDTRVIPGLMPYDTVNADRHRRGVAIEEADGIMDLGDIGSFYWAGSRYDPFFAANNDSFAWDTFPSTDNNTGGKTYLAVTRISDADTVMTMNVRFDRWKPGWPVDIGEPIGRAGPRVADLDGDGEREVVVAAESGNVYAWHVDGSPVIELSDPPGRFASARGGVSRTPAVADLDGDGEKEVIVASDAGSLHVWAHSDLDHDGAADRFSVLYPVALDGPASAAPIAADVDEGAGIEIAAASRGGFLTILRPSGEHVGASPYAFGHLVLDDVTLAAGDIDADGISEVITSTTNRGWVVALNADGTPVRGWPVEVGSWVRETVSLAVGDLDRAPGGGPEIVAVGSDGVVRAWDGGGSELAGWPVDLDAETKTRPGLADLDDDGYLEIVVPAGSSRVLGLRANGVPVENWPLLLQRGDSLGVNASPPVIGEIDATRGMDVIVAGPDGNLFAWDAVSGDLVAGWPLSSEPPAGAPWAGDADGDGYLDVLLAGRSGRVLFYQLPYAYSPGNVVWETEAGSSAGDGAYPDSLLGGEPAPWPGLMDLDRTYCYPNPARQANLVVRVFLEEPTDVEIEILDVAGQIVKRFEFEGVHTVNEVVWDTSRVASGLYIVHVEAFGPLPAGVATRMAHRPSEVKVMKVAVVR